MRPRELILAVLAVLATLGVLEAGLRLFSFTPYAPLIPPQVRDGDYSKPDDWLGWVNRPGRFVFSQYGRAVFTHLPDGRRASRPAPAPEAGADASPSASPDAGANAGPDAGPNATPGTGPDAAGFSPDPDGSGRPVVRFVGCSYTHGYEVADHETFPSLLGALLPDIRFENHAVPGYGTIQALRTMERLARDGKPADLAVYGYIDDHPVRNIGGYRFIRHFTRPGGDIVLGPRGRMDNGALVVDEPDLEPAWPLIGHSALVNLLRDAWLRRAYAEDPAEAMAVTLAAIADMNDLARRNGQDFLVVLLNSDSPVERRFFEDRGIPFVSCRNPDLYRDPRYQVEGQGHPSALQHALWAECLSGWIDAWRPGRRTEAPPRPEAP